MKIAVTRKGKTVNVNVRVVRPSWAEFIHI